MSGLLTLDDYADAYRHQAITPRQAIDDVYRRIAAYDDPAVFITLQDRNKALAEAEKLADVDPTSLPLYGIPIAVKDNIDVAGLPTTAACAAFAYRPAADATAVKKLREAGAIVIGKTNLDQFATGLVGVRSPYGVPRNTLNAALVPGGSSSGSAAAVAAGLVPLALGTDTAGSGRVPAGLNNIVGLKPSLGAVSTSGVVPACRTLDCVSVFALTVDDAWTAFRVMAGYDAADPFSRTIPLSLEPSSSMLRIGVPDDESLTFGGDANAASAFAARIAALKSAGHALHPIDLTPFFDVAAMLYDGPWVAERYQPLRDLVDNNPRALLAVTHEIIAQATKFTAADAFAGQYRLAALRRRVLQVMATIDLMIVPTFPRPRTLADLEKDPLGPNRELGTYTNFVNLLDLCALAIPSSLKNDPSGITLIANAGSDGLLSAFGRELHAQTNLPLGATQRSIPPLSPLPAATRGRIELAVVGAHLSGMALNHELTGCGAHLLRKAKTTSDYRLFALPGGPPYRPGLLRVEAGSGHGIDVEVWSFDQASFGEFVAKIPSPLGIGTLRLADGSAAKGFLAEAAGVEGAEDISRFGGWRAFMMEKTT